ncbi:MAG: hypothetical protein ACRDWS_12230 [Acidimicrobiia bacterium]
MGQEPNIEVTEAERPRLVPQPPPARRWRPDIKPGIPTSPDEVPRGGRFGQMTPDGGWALRLVRAAELPDDDPDLEAVLVALTLARAGVLGRAPVLEDLEVALVLCGYGYEAPSEVIERRERWTAAVPHEVRPGQTAAGEMDPELIVRKPEQVRQALASSSGR